MNRLYELLSEKKKFHRPEVMPHVRELVSHLQDCCEQFIVAGSLRRRKAMVGDIEFVYVPKFIEGKKCDLFAAPAPANVLDAKLAWLIEEKGILAKRESALGRTAWGDKNKLAVHVASGVPVDLFETTADAWWNYVVCRTGSAESNIRIASAAEKKGWKWHPYRAGFTDERGHLVRVNSEREVFELVGLNYLEPWER